MLRPRSVVLLLAGGLLVAGCSHLHVDSVPQWQSTTSSRLCLAQGTNPDYRDLVATTLQGGGWQVVGQCTGNEPAATVAVDYQLQWSTDLDAETRVIQRPASFHVQLRKVGEDTLLAVADYFYANPPADISVGIKEACNALAHQAEPAAKGVAASPAEASSAGVPKAEGAVETPSLAQEQAVEPSSTSAAPAEVRPMQTSPWIPRFKSWGFDAWDDSTQDDKLEQ